MTESVKAAKLLREIGFPLPPKAGEARRHDAIMDFQRGFAFWRLEPDGFAGNKTMRALKYSRAHEGRCSPHFRFAEFASKGAKAETIKVRRDLVLGLEELRDEIGAIPILSGYRDPAHNSSVGGAANSQHLYGNAIDPGKKLPLAQVKAVQRFSGIGIARADGTVRHIDVRHLGPNTTGGSVVNPTIWFYV